MDGGVVHGDGGVLDGGADGGMAPACGGACDDGDDCTAESCDTELDVCVTTTLLCGDLRGDVNRDGVVSFDDPGEDVNEDMFGADAGAIFLPNLDDDQDACPTSGSDAELAACFDAADTVMNGPSDALDMAPLAIAAWADAPADLDLTVSLDSACAANARLFLNGDSGSEHFPSGSSVPVDLVRTGAELRLEGTDILRDAAAWDGACDVTATWSASSGAFGNIPDASDVVRLQLAPVRFDHALLPGERCLAAGPAAAATASFRANLDAACQAAGIDPLTAIANDDRYIGDVMRSAQVVMPGPTGPHRLSILFRSANYTGSSLRSAGATVFTVLRGPDVGGVVQFDSTHPDAMDTLNSWSNLLILPPYTFDNVTWPHGRAVRGSVGDFYPDPSVTTLLQAQGLAPLSVDTSDFLLGHVREVMGVIPAPMTARGWVLVVADPDHAVTLLEDAFNAGHGTTELFEGKEWSVGNSAAISIEALLSDVDLAVANAEAAAAIDDMLNALAAEAGLTEVDLIRVPALFQEDFNSLVSYMPSLASGVMLDEDTYLAPIPWGPLIEGVDPFEADLETSFAAAGIDVVYIDSWDALHVLLGQLSNGVAMERQTATWWP